MRKIKETLRQIVLLQPVIKYGFIVPNIIDTIRRSQRKMFIRWKGRYAYLERRYTGKDGKVKSQSKYLGQNHLLKLEKMATAGEISEYEFKKLANCTPEGILKITRNGTLTLYDEVSCLLRNHKIAIFFNDTWLSGIIAKDEYGWYLKDDNGNITGLRPGTMARIINRV